MAVCSKPVADLKRVLVVFGTRPEAIKMAPIVRELRERSGFDVKVCATAQHREMLDQMLAMFSIVPDFDLNLMTPEQQLADLTARVVQSMREVLQEWRPDLVLVQGDTTTTFAASLAAFYERIPVGHVEAGLRTGNVNSPWPEEMNRRLTSALASYHFAPTELARTNLSAEGIDPASVMVTGNTVIDALKQVLGRFAQDSTLRAQYDAEFSYLNGGRRLVLVTGHRRENFGEGFRQICIALRELAKRKDIRLVYPVHFNPNVRGPVYQILHGLENVHLIEPLEYEAFSYLLDRCYMIITDSGGLQEEATYLGKPLLLMRDTTERPEAVETGNVKLVGTNAKKIVAEACLLLDDEACYRTMANAGNPFGDGTAARQIADYLETLKGVQVAAQVQ